MKEEIIENLKELHAEHGIQFTSEEDKLSYYKELVELIEALVMKYKLIEIR